MAESKTESKPKQHKVGDFVDVAEGAEVVRPDGSRQTVTGGSYVLDEPGTFAVDGTDVVVK